MSVTTPAPALPSAPSSPDDGRPTVVQPEGWPRPLGYANGMKATGEILVTGGVVGWDTEGRFPPDFLGQVRQTLANIRDIVRAGGAETHHIVRLTWYVTDLDAYRACLKELGPVYREIIGRHFPAMAVVQVCGLVEPQAMVEIEATAVIPVRT
ncbi:enamine deaminase RidA (YjgF/YER057c/UK114 family) [Tepidamorphus gemmatus]|uniref:Enamine deaminase RidA (YjgF/YER057c/UK114 family) n=1 Tax=Tepidamorphus gemmatus TaxID=747076 RepID=A0A4R3MAQ8_9HYPH|nr:RidA family protein [Tepidamorphus gemmatus]TCT10580.1 enamine deaminase RidA (YjgF/YER057c/UK114 family) [Tepidamorphus gemmatus]